MTPAARILALTAFVIAATSAKPAGAAIWSNGMSINGLTVNGLTVNGLSVNGLRVNGIDSPNGVQLNGLGLNAPAAESASATPRLQGRSARPLGDIGAAGTK